MYLCLLEYCYLCVGLCCRRVIGKQNKLILAIQISISNIWRENLFISHSIVDAYVYIDIFKFDLNSTFSQSVSATLTPKFFQAILQVRKI